MDTLERAMTAEESQDSEANTRKTPSTVFKNGEFQPGSPVIYALHGKCSVISIESRTFGDKTVRCYKLQVSKPALSRSTRQEPAIWLPVDAALARGLRAPLTHVESDAVLAALANREYYFNASEDWKVVQPKLEACIQHEGAMGLAKVISYLFVSKNRYAVAPSEISKFFESSLKLLVRELAEALGGEKMRPLEERIIKSMRHKLLPDS